MYWTSVITILLGWAEMDNMRVPDGFKKNTFWLRSSGNIFQVHLGASYKFTRQMLLLKIICLTDPFFPPLLRCICIYSPLLCEMVSPLQFHVHAKPSFATFTMNDTLAEELKEEGVGSSPHSESENGKMPEKSVIWWEGLSCIHREYLESNYEHKRDCSKSSTTVAGLLFCILWDPLSSSVFYQAVFFSEIK